MLAQLLTVQWSFFKKSFHSGVSLCVLLRRPYVNELLNYCQLQEERKKALKSSKTHFQLLTQESILALWSLTPNLSYKPEIQICRPSNVYSLCTQCVHVLKQQRLVALRVHVSPGTCFLACMITLEDQTLLSGFNQQVSQLLTVRKAGENIQR